MNTEPHRSLREIFFEAVEIEDASARAAFLSNACESNLSLRQRVDQLLAADKGGGPEDPKSSLGAAKSEMVGERVGRYKLLQQIGEGGCGVVFMAEQEEPIRRLVALKVIKLGMDTRQVVGRFEAERQALALMDHPNIARVLDVGAADSGRPYFVMELVRGVKITDYCDQHRFSTRRRLALFVQVCQAVQHAHQKGIIHRDLKPSNILVTELDGQPLPKVIDFGIAKAVEGRLTDQTLYTAFEQFLGTPAYMSPEQAAMGRGDIDTRSDIYSLGVLLYELLTGRTPFDTKALLATGLDAMRMTIRERDPLKPSTRLSSLTAADLANVAETRQSEAPKLVHSVRDDLDWIVMKCLEKDRSRRYETANALAMDATRHLSNEPILARPPSRVYEFQKTFQRHKLGFAAAAAIVLVLAGGVVMSSWEAARARHNADLLRRQAYLADMNVAQQALRKGNLGLARDRLRRYVPKPGEVDLRNWEWRYLANEAQGDPSFALKGYSGAVPNVRYLDDNTLLTTVPAEWRTILWNLSERRPQGVITNQSGAGGVSSRMCLSPRRHALFYRVPWPTAAVTVLNLDSGVERPFLTAAAEVTSLDLSPDESLLAVAGGAQVELWDLQHPARQYSFPVNSYAASRAAFSPDGRELVIGDMSGHLDRWDLAKRTKTGSLTNELGGVNALRFSPDGRWLVSVGVLGGARVCRVQDWSWVAELDTGAVGQAAAFSRDGLTLAVVGGDSIVRLWDSVTWQKRPNLKGHTDQIWSVDFSPNGRFLATGSRNGEIMVWPLTPPPRMVDSVTFSNKAVYWLVAQDGNGFGRIARWQKNGDVHRFPEVELWSSSPIKRMGTIPTDDLAVTSAMLLPGARGIVLSCADGRVHLRGLGAEKNAVAPFVYGDDAYVDVSRDGSVLVTVGLESGGGWVGRFWRLPQLTLFGQPVPSTVALRPKLAEDGTLLTGFTGSGDMGVWKVPPLKVPPMWRAFGALENVPAIAFSPMKDQIAAAVDLGGLFLWNLKTWRRTVLASSSTSYTSLSYSRDGTRLAAGSGDEAKLFDAGTGDELLSFEPRGLKLAFLPDSQRLLAVHSEGASVLRAPPLEEIQDCDWLKEKPSQEPPDYPGPRPPGRELAPRSAQKHRQ